MQRTWIKYDLLVVNLIEITVAYFFNLRDKFGVTQIVCGSDPATQHLLPIAQDLHLEYVVGIKGVVKRRPAEALNKNLTTGEIEVWAQEIEILNTCKVLPFDISVDTPVNDNLMLKYRYLYLRRPVAQKFILDRYKITKTVRDFLHNEGFTEIETPLLTKTTPEGARDFLVPSRLYPGTFFALPQSPQQYKQLLMYAGFDKYFQIARAIRMKTLALTANQNIHKLIWKCLLWNETIF